MESGSKVALFNFSLLSKEISFVDQEFISSDTIAVFQQHFPVWIDEKANEKIIQLVKTVDLLNFKMIVVMKDNDNYAGMAVITNLNRHQYLQSEKQPQQVGGVQQSRSMQANEDLLKRNKNKQQDENGITGEKAHPKPDPKAPVKFLLVDDNKHSNKIITYQLEKLNIQTEIATNGVEAIFRVSENHYSLILMDVAMPGLSGIETARIIRSMLPEPNRSTPIIVLTASHFTEIEKEMASAEINGYIHKPLTVNNIQHELLPFYLKIKTETRIQTDETIDGSRAKDNTVGRISRVAHPAQKPKKDDFLVNDKIDLTYLKEVSLGDRSFAAEVIGDFLQNTDIIIKNIRNCLFLGDFQKCREFSHKLKPTLSYMGLKQIIPLMEQFHSIILNRRISRENKLKMFDEITKLISESYNQLNQIRNKFIGDL